MINKKKVINLSVLILYIGSFVLSLLSNNNSETIKFFYESLNSDTELTVGQKKVAKEIIDYVFSDKFTIIFAIILTILSYLAYVLLFRVLVKSENVDNDLFRRVVNQSYILSLIPIIVLNTLNFIFVNDLILTKIGIVLYFIPLILSVEISFFYFKKMGYKLYRKKTILYVIMTSISLGIWFLSK